MITDPKTTPSARPDRRALRRLGRAARGAPDRAADHRVRQQGRGARGARRSSARCAFRRRCSRSGWPADALRGEWRAAPSRSRRRPGWWACSWSPGCPHVPRPSASAAVARDLGGLPTVTIAPSEATTRIDQATAAAHRGRPRRRPRGRSGCAPGRRHGRGLDRGGRRVARRPAACDRLADGGDPHLRGRASHALARALHRTGTADGDRCGDGHRQAGWERHGDAGHRPHDAVHADLRARRAGREIRRARLAQREAGVPRRAGGDPAGRGRRRGRRRSPRSSSPMSRRRSGSTSARPRSGSA